MDHPKTFLPVLQYVKPLSSKETLETSLGLAHVQLLFFAIHWLMHSHDDLAVGHDEDYVPQGNSVMLEKDQEHIQR